MQEADPRADVAASRNFLTPTRAFVVALAVLATALALWLANGRDAVTVPSSNPVSTPSTLSKVDAISVFEVLNETRNRAYRERDVTLIEQVYVTGTESYQIAHSEIGKLLEDEVIDRSRYRTQSVNVESISPTEIVLTEGAIVRPRFITESGENVNSEDAAMAKQNVRWTLTNLQGTWLIADVLITKLEAAQ